MFGVRSARGRAVTVGLVLVVFLAGITAFTIWRTQSDNRQLHELERASDAATALEHARAQLLLQTSLLSALAFSQDASLVDEFGQAQAALEQDLIVARAEATNRGDEAQLAILDDLAVQMVSFEAASNLAIPLLLEVDASQASQMAAAYRPEFTANVDAMYTDLDQLAENGRGHLAAVRAAMDHDAEVTFWFTIARSALAFVLTAGIATVVLLSILRPLATLRLSARAIAAGNLKARTKVYGPEEVASLARDFNRMTDALAAKTEEYITTTNLTGDIIGRLDAENRWTFLNDAACEFFGKPRERLLGTDAAAIMHPDDLESTAQALQDALASKEPRQGLVNRVVTPLGTRVVEWNACPLFGKKGQHVGFQTTGRDITKREEMEQALRESEARYRLLAENTSDLIWTMDLSLRYTYMSPAVTRMRGYSVDEIVGTTVQEAMTPASLEVARKTLAEQLALERDGSADPNRSTKLDLEMYCKDGSTIWTEMNMTFLRGADGRPVGILGVTRDITERKRAEEELLRQGAVLSVINRVLQETLSCETEAEVASVCIEEAQKLTDSEFGFIGRINEANRFDTIAMTDPGWDACRMPRSNSVMMIKGMELRGIWSTALRDERSVIVNDPQSCPDRVGTPPGHPPLTSFLGVPLKHRGKTIGAIGLANKASGYDAADQENVEAISMAFVEALNRKQAEAALEESEKRYRLITQNATDLIWTTDMNLRYTYISPSVLRLRGFTVEEAITHTVEEDICPSSLEAAMKALAEEMAREGSGEKASYRWRTLELEHFCKDGSTIWLEVTTTFLRDEDGRPVGLLGSSRDITERRQVTEALRESEEKYRRVVDDSADGIVIVEGFELKFVNRASLKMYGGDSEEEIVGRPFTDFVAPEDRELLVEWRLAREAGQDPPGHYEFKALRKDGTKFDAELSVSLISYEGRPALQGIIRDITERKRAEEALRESEEKYRDLVENTSEVIYALDADGVVTYVSPAVERLGAYKPSEVIGRSFSEFIHPDDLLPLMQSFQRTVAGDVEPFEYRVLAKSGEAHWVRTFSRLVYEGERVVGVRAVLMDITERKRAEQALEEGEKRYRLLAENASDIIWTAEVVWTPDLDLRITYESPAVTQIRGYTPEEVMAQKMEDNLTPASLEVARKALAEELAPEKIGSGDLSRSRTLELEHTCKDGSTVWLEVTVTFLRGADGQAVGLLGVSRDISERKRAEQALEGSERRYRLLAENASDIIWTTDMNLQYTYMSPSVERLRGYTVEEAMSHAVEQDLCPSSLDLAMRVLAEEVATKTPYRWRTLDLEYTCKDGSTIWLEVTTTFLTDEDGRRVGLLGSSRDISERRRAEKALEKSERRYRLLAENASDIIWTMDMNLRYTYESPAVTRIRGYTPEEAMAQTIEETLTPASLEVARKALAEELVPERMERGDLSRTRTLELEHTCKDGSTVWLEVTVAFLRDENGQLVGLLGASRDISERKRAEQALEESKERYRLLAENVSDVIFTTDLSMRYTYVSPSVKRMRGYSVEEVMAGTLADSLAPQSLEEARTVIAEELIKASRGERVPSRTVEVELNCKDGSTIWTEVTASFLRNEDGQPIGLLGVSRDITERKRAEEERKRLHSELETRAITDSLTGLHNHAYFYECLADEIDRSRRYGHRFALVMMDVDAFKHYNDSRGHQEGDAALRLVGECIRSAMRRSDRAFRYGGDEFVAILLNADVSRAQDVVRRINKRIATRLKEAGDSAAAWLGVSAGVACYPDDATTVDELVRMADTAMYDAKRLAWARGVMGRGGQAVESAACQVGVPHETQTGMLSSAANSLAEAIQDLTPPEAVAGSDLRTIAALGAAAEIKDPFIHGHQERTSRLAAIVAKEMGLSADRVRNITSAGLLHDLGKFSVGENILTKPGKLTESEYAKMKEHPTLGANMIVSGAEALQPLAPIVRHHHERFDGSGYPDGLARENIPLEARILGVADVFDAMTHERSYRKALSAEEALGEIERGAGTRFDRAVVEAFLGIMKRRGGELG